MGKLIPPTLGIMCHIPSVGLTRPSLIVLAFVIPLLHSGCQTGRSIHDSKKVIAISKAISKIPTLKRREHRLRRKREKRPHNDSKNYDVSQQIKSADILNSKVSDFIVRLKLLLNIHPYRYSLPEFEYPEMAGTYLEALIKMQTALNKQISNLTILKANIGERWPIDAETLLSDMKKRSLECDHFIEIIHSLIQSR
jgi:hypothetical protein